MKTVKFYLQYLGKRLFYLTLTVLILYGSYCYSVPEFSIGGHLFKNIFYHEHSIMVAWLYYLEYFIFIFLILTGLIFILTLYYGFDKRRKEKTLNWYMEFYVTYLLYFIFTKDILSEKEMAQKKNKFRKFVRNDYSRELILNTLQQIHHQVIGKMRRETEQLLNELNYNNLIRSYLHSPYNRHKKIALNTISEFKIYGFEKYMLQLAKRKRNKLLHTDVLVALTRLNTYENLIQLIKNNVNISMWEVNVIIDNIEKDKIREIPYKELLHSNNKGMLILGIILSRLNQKQEFIYDIKMYIESPDENINEEAILAFASFAKDRSDFVYLRESYNKATERGKLFIIRSVSQSPDTEYAVRFLQWVAINEPVNCKVEALKNLLIIDICKVAEFMNVKDPQVRMACNEVLDINQ